MRGQLSFCSFLEAASHDVDELLRALVLIRFGHAELFRYRRLASPKADRIFDPRLAGKCLGLMTCLQGLCSSQ